MASSRFSPVALKHRIASSLQAQTILLLVGLLTLGLAAFGVFDVLAQRQSQEEILIEKGRILSLTGARTTARIFEDALASGKLTREQLFDATYVPIAGTNPPKFHTAYDAFTDRAMQEIEDEFLKDADVVFAVVVDTNGYLPTHNTKYSPTSGDPLLNRTKRMFNDPVGLAAGQNTSPFLRQVYQRDTGETMWDLSAPIEVQGQHWGAFRIGFSIQRADARIAAATWRTVAGLSGVALLLAVLLGLVVSRIARAVTQVGAVARRIAQHDLPSLASAVDALADGDLTQRATVTARPIAVDRADELGRMAGDFNQMTDALQETASAFDRTRGSLRDLLGRIQGSALELAAMSARVGSAATETGTAVQQVSQAVEEVARGAEDTSRSAQETNAAVGQLAQAIDGIARGAQDQASQVAGATRTADEMAGGVEQVAGNAQTVATASGQAKAAAEHGAQAVQEAVEGMAEIRDVVGRAAVSVEELGKLGEKIGAVVETIDDIAEQTNLLALNAAIEAARAGEHGKGFAVVADEVRKLAERSSRETKAIAELIEQVQAGTLEAVKAMERGSSKVEAGSEKAEQAGRALAEILDAAEQTVAQAKTIAAAAEEMAGGARSVTEVMVSMSAVVQENSAATEQMAAQAGQVTSAIQSIAAVSEQQSASTEQVSASTDQMTAQVDELSAQAKELAEAADQLKGLVSRFKLEGADGSPDLRLVA